MIKILDFYADWCGPCKVMEPVLEEMEKIYAGKVEFKRIDVEVDGEISGKYGVLGIPTFVIEKDGKEIDRKVGAMQKDTFKNWIESRVNS